jgi:fibronectin-binding autotransporter adhesin
MRRNMLKKQAVVASAAIAVGAVCSGPLRAVTYVYEGPFTGTGASANPWSTSSWLNTTTGTPATPVSSPSTTIDFQNFDANSATAYNDISSSFQLNSIVIDNWSTTSNSLYSAQNSQMQLTGASPTVVLNGPGSATIGGQQNASGSVPSGLFLNPTSGTTTIQGGGSATSVSFGTTPISGTGGLTVATTGLGYISIAGTNTYTGGLTLQSGILQLGSNYSTGATNTLTVNGGYIRSLSGALTGTVIANSDINYLTGSLTISGALTGSGGLHLMTGYGTVANTLTLSNGTNSYSGITQIDSGPILQGTGGSYTLVTSGMLGNTSLVSVGYNGILSITGSSANTRIPDLTPVNVSGGQINVSGLTAGSAFTETAGALTTSGLADFAFSNASTGAATSVLTFSSLTRPDSGTLLFRGNWYSTTSSTTNCGELKFTTAPSLSSIGSGTGTAIQLLPYAAGATSATATTPTAFITYGTNGIQQIPFTSATNVVQLGNISGGSLTSNQNVNVNFNTSSTSTSPAMINSTVTVNAFANTAAQYFGGTGTLTVASGALLTGSTVTFNGPTLDFGSTTGYIQLGSSFSVTGASTITGSGGLVISANSATQAFQFSNVSNSAVTPNNFTGGLTINGGLVSFVSDTQLGSSGQGINLSGGSLEYNNTSATPATIARPIYLGAAGGNIFTSSLTLTLSGNITGPGSLSDAATSSGGSNAFVALTGTNTYAGSTYLYSGELVITSDSNLGAGPVDMLGGGLQLASNATFNHQITLESSGTIDTSSFSPTVASAITNFGVAATLTKIGSGTLNLTANNSEFGQTLTIYAGAVSLSGNGALPQLENINVEATTTFQFNNSGTDLNTRYSPLSRVTLAGGTLDMLGNSGPTSASNQSIGGLFLPAAYGNLVAAANQTSYTTSIVSVEPASAMLTVTGAVVGAPLYSAVTNSGTVHSLTPADGSGVPAWNYATFNTSATSVTKAGVGTLVLAGTSTFAGGMIINAGTVRTASTTALGYGAPVYSAVGSEQTIGSTSIAAGGSLDLYGKAITEPITLNGGSLTNSSPSVATLTSGIKGITSKAQYDSAALVDNPNGTTVIAGFTGTGYTTSDTVTVGGSGTGATASLVLGISPLDVSVSNPGSYSTGSPTVSISGGGGSGAQASAVIDTSYHLLGIVVTNPGYGYTSVPTFTISLPSGSTAATYTSNASAGLTVVGVQETNPGTGYTPGNLTYTVNSATGGAIVPGSDDPFAYNGDGTGITGAAVSSVSLTANSSVGGSGDLVLAGQVYGSGGLTKSGSDTVTLSASNTYSGGTNVASGTLSVTNAFGLGSAGVNLTGGTLGLLTSTPIANSVTALSGNSVLSFNVASGSTNSSITSLTVNSGATLKLSATGVTGARTVLTTSGLSVSGTLDIQNNALDLPGTTVAAITPLVASGFAGGTWQGTGITSSTAATDSTHLRAVGMISNDNGMAGLLYGSGGTITSTFAGASPAYQDVLVKLTYYGDTDLNGVIDGSDYSRIDASFLSEADGGPNVSGWYNGDFNYDGVVDGSDYTLIDNAFNSQGTSLAALIASPLATATAQLAGSAGTSAVPEPAMLGLMGLGATGLLGRRRRR